MANRFTDTEKWKDEWFLTLEPTMKILWLYICDTCDFAGVWKVNFTLASFSVGTILDKQSALNALGDRIKVLSDDKWHVPKFIYFQQKGFLKTSNNAHKGIIKLLDFHGIEASPYLAPEEPQESDSIDSLDPKVKVKVKVKVDSSLNLIIGIDSLIQLFNDTLASKAGRISYCHGLSANQIQDFITTSSFKEFQSIETWEEIFKKVGSSNFLNGSTGDFVATLNWLVKHDNALKVLNGQFDGTGKEQKPGKKSKTPITPDNPTGNPYLEQLRQMEGA